MAPQLWPRLNSCFLIIFVFLLQSNGITQGAYFTRKPPALQYVLEGQNATFNWDYSTSSRNNLLLGTLKKLDSSIICITITPSAVIYSSAAECKNFVLEGNATLILTNVSKAMDGDYECDLSITDRKLRNTASLRVVSKVPTFTSSQSSVTGIEGGNSVVVTTEIAGDYLPVISWHKNSALVNTTLYPTSSREINSTVVSDKMVQANLTIVSVKRNINNDNFVVKAAYGTHSPTSNTSIKIIVWYGPENLRISSTRSGMGVSDGQSVTVNCSADSNPPSNFTIFHNNSVVVKNSASGVLTILSFSRNDSGNYSCMATNEVSNATVDGVWFVYAEPVITTSTTQKPTSRTSNGTTEQSNTTVSTNPTSKAAERTGTTDELLPWWAWMAIGLGIFVFIALVVFGIWIVRRQSKEKNTNSSKQSQKKVPKNPKMMSNNHSLGYENQFELRVDEEKGANRERSIDNPYPEEAVTNLSVKFESEHDLIAHWKQRPEDYDDDDGIFKNIDPFEEDDTDGLDPNPEVIDNRMAFDNNVYQEDDIIKVKSESEKESDKEPELFTESDDGIVTYNI